MKNPKKSFSYQLVYIEYSDTGNAVMKRKFFPNKEAANAFIELNNMKSRVQSLSRVMLNPLTRSETLNVRREAAVHRSIR